MMTMASFINKYQPERFSLLLLAIGLCISISAEKKGNVVMEKEYFTPDVKEYLSATDPMSRAGVKTRYPGIENKMKEPRTHSDILTWLASEFPWKSEYASFAANCLSFLYSEASESERERLRPFLLHYDAQVRLKAYDYFVLTYFPDKNKQALLLLMESMLVDDDDRVRIAGIRYIERIGAEKEFINVFRAWQFLASLKAWQQSGSAELVAGIIQKYGQK
jgi:hypothetical protein